MQRLGIINYRAIRKIYAIFSDNFVFDIFRNAGTTANGGNIIINANNNIIQLENSDITANAIQGRGGNIIINTQGIFKTSDSHILAASERGINGIVDITTPDTNQDNSLNKQPSNFISADAVMASSCIVRKTANGAFVVTGNNGLAELPSDNLSMAYSLLAVQAVNVAINKDSQITAMPEWKLGDQVKEATQLVKTLDGCLILASLNTNPTSAQNLICN